VFRDESRFACALQALDRREFAAAERELERLLAQPCAAGERAFLLNKRGVARIGLDRRALAREDFSAALAVRPQYAPALTNLGNLLLEEGDIAGAIARYEAAIGADSEYAIAHLNLGVAYKRAGRIAEGVRSLRRAQVLEQRANAVSSWRRVRRR
jgi:lipoprotein NlpI